MDTDSEDDSVVVVVSSVVITVVSSVVVAAEEVGTVGAWLVEVTEEDDGSEGLLAPLEE